MIKSKELIGVKIICAILLICTVVLNEKNIEALGVIFILLLVINNNLRIFYISNSIYFKISIFIEIIAATLGYCFFSGNIVIYLIGTIVDIFTIENKKHFRAFICIIIFVIASSYYYGSIDNLIKNYMIVSIILLLLNYIKSLYISKACSDRLYEKLRKSEAKLVEANKELENYSESIQELTLLKERNRISREIHDSVGHALTTTMIQLSAIESISRKGNYNISEMIKSLREFVNESFQDVKKAVKELKPAEYENYQGILRIEEVCKNFEKLSGVKVKTRISKGDWTLTGRQFQNIYRITQEALSNSLRHGKSTLVNVIMNFTETEFIISFKDNGSGTKEIKETGVGIKSIKERVEELNGIVNMNSKEGEGFFIKISIPKEREV